MFLEDLRDNNDINLDEISMYLIQDTLYINSQYIEENQTLIFPEPHYRYRASYLASRFSYMYKSNLRNSSILAGYDTLDEYIWRMESK